MGRQINFYMLPEDVASFQKMLEEKHPDTCFIADASQSEDLKFLATLAVHEMGRERLKVYLVQRPFLSLVHMRRRGSIGEWLVDGELSPVIEFGRCLYDGRILRAGRLYFTTGFYAENGQWVQKPLEFAKWAESILKWVRRNYRKDSLTGYYVGAQAYSWSVQQQGLLSPY